MSAEDGDMGTERMIGSWTVSEVRDLLAILHSKTTKNDKLSYTKRIARLNWQEITVREHSSEECKEQLQRLLLNVRLVRNLEEILHDAFIWVENPKSSDLNPSEHPDFPKSPLTTYLRFYSQVFPKLKIRHPDLGMKVLTAKVAKRWEKLSDDEKKEYSASYQADMVQYVKLKDAFFLKHPEYIPSKPVSKPRGGEKEKGPALPKPPFWYFSESKISAESDEERKQQMEALKIKWTKEMSDKRKIKYIKMAVDDEKRYKGELEAFLDKHPDSTLSRKHRSRVSIAEMDLLANSYGRPKAPTGTSGYRLFCSEYHQKLLANGQTIDNKKWMAKASTAWNACAPELKDVYNKRAIAAREEYRNACEVYLAELPEETREEERAIINATSNGTKKRKDETHSEPSKRKRNSEPLKPLTGRSIYILEELDKCRKKNPNVGDDVVKRILQQTFEKLPQDKKQMYEKKAELFSKIAG